MVNDIKSWFQEYEETNPFSQAFTTRTTLYKRTIKYITLFLLWLTIYTHHLPHLTFYFDRRWDLEWHFCHKLQLRKWLHGVNLFFVLVTKCSFEMREIKRKHVLMWGVKKNLEPLRFSFLLWHGGIGYNYGVCLRVMFGIYDIPESFFLNLRLRNLLFR